VTRRSTRCADGKLRLDLSVAQLTLRLNSSTAFYKKVMGIKSVTAVSDTELHLEYDARDQSVVLMLAFDPLTKRLVNAQVSHKHRIAN